ncbi:MAG: hypothetical protein U0325_35665 [Polyangiales bacterium]
MDRATPWSAVDRALGVAWGLGVRRAEVLFTRGRVDLALRPGAPPEAGYVLPRDFGAVALTLAADAGDRPDPAARFDDATRAWPARRAVTVRVSAAADAP